MKVPAVTVAAAVATMAMSAMAMSAVAAMPVSTVAAMSVSTVATMSTVAAFGHCARRHRERSRHCGHQSEFS